MTDDNHHAGQMVRITLIGLRDTVPFPIRLRQALKHLLRTARLRAVSVEPVSPFRNKADQSGPTTESSGPGEVP